MVSLEKKVRCYKGSPQTFLYCRPYQAARYEARILNHFGLLSLNDLDKYGKKFYYSENALRTGSPYSTRHSDYKPAF